MPGTRYSEMALDDRHPVNYVVEDDVDETIVDNDGEQRAEVTRPLMNQEMENRDRPAIVADRLEDDELTNLTWLQNRNLLQACIGNGNASSVIVNGQTGASFTARNASNGCVIQHASIEDEDEDGDQQHRQQQKQHIGYNPAVHVCSKPPYSFSCLIFMAIEDSPSQALPVKDIYSWILAHFPYFQNAPTGWKNSVRHNLSLNKCFLKVDKGQNIAKGSLWCVDPEHRPNLLQALRKTPFKPCIRLPSDLMSSANATNMNTVDHIGRTSHCSPVLVASNNGNVNLINPVLFPYLSKRLSPTSTEDVDVDAAATMLSLKNGPRLLSSLTANGDHKSRTRDESGCKTMTSFNPAREKRQRRLQEKLSVFDRERRWSRNGGKVLMPQSVIVSPSMGASNYNDDHTYSSSSTNSPVTDVRHQSSGHSPSSSIDEPFEFGIVNGYKDHHGVAYSSPPPSTSAVRIDDGDSGGDSGVTRSESSDEGELDDSSTISQRPKSVRCPVIVRTVTTATGHCKVVIENEEQMKIVEGAANALLNLAGFNKEVATVAPVGANRVRRKRKPSRRHLRQILPAIEEAHQR